jgi:hypothetical protein
LVQAGDVVHQRPGITHYLYDYSKDMGVPRDRQPRRLQDRRRASRGRQGAAAHAVELTAVSSPEELTFVFGRWLRPIAVVLYVVRRLGWRPTSSREQERTAPNQ